MSKPSAKLMRAIGLMSGTSMDGIDVALIETDGQAFVRRLGFVSVAYDDAFRERLRQGLRDATGITMRTARPGILARLERELTERHAAAVTGFLQTIKLGADDIDLIAFHGQTVLHRPEAGLTVQIGDGARLAELTGIDVVYDLRAADVAGGGQGAPLAPVYHRAMVAQFEGEATAVLNIGGVANVTFIGPGESLLAFDTGPGNALLDDWVREHTEAAYDVDGRTSASGKVDSDVISAWMQHEYFQLAPPKSLDRNAFDMRAVSGFSLEDGAATLAAFTVESVVHAARYAEEMPARWIVCGGGRRNATLMAGLRSRLPEVMAAEDAEFDGDAIEAEAWAYLGVRSRLELPTTFPGTTGVARAMTGGTFASVVR